MNASGPFDKVKHYPSQLLGQFITEPAPIHTYRNTIRIRKPYISFIFLDTDSVPTLTSIPVKAPDPLSLIHDIAPRRPELHALQEGYWVPHYKSEKPITQSFNFTISDSSIEATTIPKAQKISLDFTFDPNEQRDIPTNQSFSLEAIALFIEEEISLTVQNVSMDVTFDPNDQRDQPIIQLHKPDARTGSIERSISLTEQQVSVNATRDLDRTHKGISTNQYVVENILAQSNNTKAGQEQQCDSYSHLMLIFEPSCYNFKIPEAKKRCMLLRYHRYSRGSRIVSNRDKA
jgi:hypothetical protein